MLMKEHNPKKAEVGRGSYQQMTMSWEKMSATSLSYATLPVVRSMLVTALPADWISMIFLVEASGAAFRIYRIFIRASADQ
jgi:hypothetical protein